MATTQSKRRPGSESGAAAHAPGPEPGKGGVEEGGGGGLAGMIPDLLALVAGHLSAADRCLARATCRHLAQHLPGPGAASGPVLLAAADATPAVAEYVLDRCRLSREATAPDLARLGLLGRLRRRAGELLLLPRGGGAAELSGVCLAAAGAGRLEVLSWAWDEGLWCDASAAAAAAGAGHWEAAEWLAERGGADDRAVAAAAGRGDAAAVRRLRLRHGLPFTAAAAAAAARAGHGGLALWLADNGCALDGGVAAAAAGRGDVRLLGALLSERGCECDSRAFRAAAGGGHLPALELLRARGCPWDWRALEAALARRPLDASTLDWLADGGFLPNPPGEGAHLVGLPDVCALAVASGAPGAVDWALRRGYRLCRWLSVETRLLPPGEAGAMLRHLADRGCELDPYAVAHAVARLGGEALAEWAVGSGRWEWRPSAASASLAGGHTALFDWAARRGLPVSPDAMVHLAARGDARRAAWLLERGHEWSSYAAGAAARGGQAGFLRWAAARGCPVGAEALEALAAGGDVATLRWLDAPGNGTRWEPARCAPGRRRVWTRVALRGALAHPPAVLRYLLLTGAVASAVDGGVMGAAARSPDREALFLLLDELRRAGAAGPGVLAEAMRHLAGAGDVGAMRRALDQGCPLTSGAPAMAAANGHAPALRWLRERGCRFDARVCAELAARGDARGMLEARARGWGWDHRASLAAAEAAAASPAAALGALAYVLAGGCPLCNAVWEPAVAAGRPEQLALILGALRPGRAALRLVERVIVRYGPPGAQGALTRALLAHAGAGL